MFPCTEKLFLELDHFSYPKSKILRICFFLFFSFGHHFSWYKRVNSDESPIVPTMADRVIYVKTTLQPLSHFYDYYRM